MIKFEVGTKVKITATGEIASVIALDGYGSVQNFLHLNPKPYILDILDEKGDLRRFDADELESQSN